jgi:hypothetical protein
LPTNAIESGVGALWKAKQTALGTVEPSAATQTKMVRKATDDGLKAAKVYGSEEYVDGQSWGSPGMYVDTVGGDVGTVTYQAQIETAGAAFASIIGIDVVTGTGPDYTHTITTSTVRGLNLTYRQKVGQAVGPWRNSFWDARLNKLTYTCGQGQNVAHIMENVFAMKAASWFTTDPVAVDSGTDPFNWNEVTGSIAVNSITLPEVESETFEFDRKIDVHRGDSAAPICFVDGKGEINRSMSALVTDTDIPIIQQILYGTTTMSDGLAVSNTVVDIPMISVYTRTSVRSLSLSTPKVTCNAADFEIAPRAEGGKIPVTFGGRCRATAGSICTVIAKTADATTYV